MTIGDGEDIRSNEDSHSLSYCSTIRCLYELLISTRMLPTQNCLAILTLRSVERDLSYPRPQP
jgi:hypothetical protein